MANTVLRPKRRTELTPDVIVTSLFGFRDRAHKFHLNTMVIGAGSYAQHKALDTLYKGIQDLQDDILEQMMGYLNGPINDAGSIDLPNYQGTSEAIALCDEIISFSTQLIEYASANNMPNIENLAQELSGLGAHAKYFLMFK